MLVIPSSKQMLAMENPEFNEENRYSYKLLKSCGFSIATSEEDQQQL